MDSPCPVLLLEGVSNPLLLGGLYFHSTETGLDVRAHLLLQAQPSQALASITTQLLKVPCPPCPFRSIHCRTHPCFTTAEALKAMKDLCTVRNMSPAQDFHRLKYATPCAPGAILVVNDG